MNVFEEFEETIFSTDIEPNFTINTWDSVDVSKILSIDEEDLDFLINRVGKECAKIGWKYSFDINFIKSFGSYTITTVGMYQLLELSSTLKNYSHFKQMLPYFSDMAISDLIRYQGYKQRKIKSKKKSNSNYNFEMQGEFDSKKFNSDLKIPNLDIEDKSHLFYNKRVVITGTFENYPKRQEMARLIKSVGGDNNTSISGKTDFVIVGENAGPSKMEKIIKLEITTINEYEFIELFEK